MQNVLTHMDEEVIHIVCCTDHNYVMPCGVMLKSLFVNNENCKIHVHVIIDSTVISSDKILLENIAKNEQETDISFYFASEIQNVFFPQIGGHTHITRPAYYRLFITTILPASLAKVLYLDVDLLVLGSIKELWNINLDGYALGAVIESEIDAIEHYNRLKYPKEYGLINSGVLLINLDYWRKNNLQQLFLDFIKNHTDRILYHDQDVLNGTLYDKIKKLPLKYNVQTAFFYRSRFVKYDIEKYQQDVEEAKKMPVILHFSTSHKPWNSDCLHPRRHEFLKYRDMTIWKGEPLVKKCEPLRPFRTIIGDLLRLIGLKKPIEQKAPEWLYVVE